MSFITRIKQFFAQFSTQSEQHASLSLDELRGWCETRLRGLVREHNLSDTLRVYIRSLEHKRVYLEGRLGIWDERLDLAHQQLRFYFAKLRSVLATITFSDSFGESLRVHASLLHPLEELREALEKSKYSHDFTFLLDEQERGQVTMNPLIKEIVEMQALVREFEEKLASSGLRVGERITQKASDLLREHERVARLEGELLVLNKRLEASESRSEEKKQEVSRLRNDKGLNSVLEQRARDHNNLQVYEQAFEQVGHLFAPLREVLLYYHEHFASELALRYAHFADQALLGDEALHILHILDHLRALVRENKLGIALSEVEGVIQALEKINEDLLRLLVKGLLEKPKQTHESDGVRDLLVEKYEDAQYRFEHFFKQRKRLARACSRVEEDLEIKRARFVELKQELMGLIKLHYHTSVTLTS